jgi:hypothetical protein
MASFLTGIGADGQTRWAGIDELAHHLEGRVCDTRFGAYCAPFRSEGDAKAALEFAGCNSIAAEAPRRGRR